MAGFEHIIAHSARHRMHELARGFSMRTRRVGDSIYASRADVSIALTSNLSPLGEQWFSFASERRARRVAHTIPCW
jgi:hypothetical protein